jgi:hypothetical protein
LKRHVEILLDALAVVLEPIRISYLWRPVLPHAGDDLVLERPQAKARRHR